MPDEKQNGDKKKSSPRLTVTLPSDLRQRMRQAGNGVNWSAVATEAFEQKLLELEAAMTQTHDQVGRLPADSERFIAVEFGPPKVPRRLREREIARGREAGNRWAEARAEWCWLEKIEDVRNRLGGYFRDGALSADGNSTLGPLLDHLFLYFARANDWRAQVWLCSRFDAEPCLYPDPGASLEYIHGFLLGTLDVWDTIKDRV
jgi:hypothetical protein